MARYPLRAQENEGQKQCPFPQNNTSCYAVATNRVENYELLHFLHTCIHFFSPVSIHLIVFVLEII